MDRPVPPSGELEIRLQRVERDSQSGFCGATEISNLKYVRFVTDIQAVDRYWDEFAALRPKGHIFQSAILFPSLD